MEKIRPRFQEKPRIKRSPNSTPLRDIPIGTEIAIHLCNNQIENLGKKFTGRGKIVEKRETRQLNNPVISVEMREEETQQSKLDNAIWRSGVWSWVEYKRVLLGTKVIKFGGGTAATISEYRHRST